MPNDLQKFDGMTDDDQKKYGDDKSLVEDVNRRFKILRDKKAPWNKLAKEDVAFALGNQWKPEDRATLESQGRPVLTFNKIKPMIELVTGHVLQNWNRIKVSPEGGEDKIFSEVMDKLLGHLNKLSTFEEQMELQFPGATRAGEAWIEFYLDYDDDPIFGTLKCDYLGPFGVYADGDLMKYNASDGDELFKVRKISKGKLKQKYPDLTDKLEELGVDNDEALGMGIDKVVGDKNDYGLEIGKSKAGITTSPTNQLETGDSLKLTVLERWYKKYVDRWFVYFEGVGDLKKFDTDAEAESEIQNRYTQPPPTTPDHILTPPPKVPPKYIKKKVKTPEAWVCVKTNGIVLAHGKSGFEPYYHGFPFFRFIFSWAPEAADDTLKTQGLTRSLKDPQIEKNKAKSQFLHILNTSANSGWVGDDDALTAEKKLELKNFGSTPGITVWKKPGSQLERIQPVAPDLANQVREKAADDAFKEVTGINADLLSIDASSSPSGKAIALRIRQAITILEPAFKNFQKTKRHVGEFLFRIVPMLFDSAKVKKVLGAEYLKTSDLQDAAIEAFLIMIEDGKYNVSIAEAGQSKTFRDETLETLLEMVKSGMPLPPDLLLEFMDIPNSKEVLARVQAYQQQALQAQTQQQR
mgnify:CR=1 FL=1